MRAQTNTQAARAGVAAVMLTVMRANAAALALYAGLGYREHETSPGYGGGADDKAGYVIMFKALPRPRSSGGGGGGCGCSGHHHHHHGHDHGHGHHHHH